MTGKHLNRAINFDGQGTAAIKTSTEYERHINYRNDDFQGTVEALVAEEICVTKLNMETGNGV